MILALLNHQATKRKNTKTRTYITIAYTLKVIAWTHHFAELGRIPIPTALSEGDIEVPSRWEDELSEGYNSTYPYDEETMDSYKILKELKKEAKKRTNKKEAERQRDIAKQKKEKKKKGKAQAEGDVESFASFCDGMASEDEKCGELATSNKQASVGKNDKGANGKKKGKWSSYTPTSLFYQPATRKRTHTWLINK